MIDILSIIAGSLAVALAGFFAYMSNHLVSEKKAGRTLPLPWERYNKTKQNFDKSSVKYTDGDNT